MGTAWGPRISAASSDGVAIAAETETAIATVGPISATEINYRVWIHGWFQLAANADTTAVGVKVYRGDIATGVVVGTGSSGPDAFAGDGAPFVIDALDDVGPGGEQVTYTLAVTMTGSSGESDAAPVVFVATVF